MTAMHGRFLALVAFGALLTCTREATADISCSEVSKQAEKEQSLINPVSGFKVIGTGRLYFYSAPDGHCRLRDVFLVPGDEITAYDEFMGWLDVMYTNPKTSEDYEGWVDSKRLKFIGTEQPRDP
jgi:hypothetical protein